MQTRGGGRLNGEVGNEVEGPFVVQNLSPRLSNGHKVSNISTLDSLNIDQTSAFDQGFRRARVKGTRAIFPSDRKLRSSLISSLNSFQLLSHD